MKSILIICILFFYSCGDDFSGMKFEGLCNSEEVISVRYMGEFTKSQPEYITDDLILSGVVVANDITGNYYRRIVIADQTGGFELLAGYYHMYRHFPIGRRVHLSLKGLVLHNEMGLLEVGISERMSDSEYYQDSPDYFNSYFFLSNYLCLCNDIEEVKPIKLNVNELRYEHLGMLVQIDGLERVIPYDIDEKPDVWANLNDELREFETVDEYSLLISTSSYADFALESIPHETLLSFIGVLIPVEDNGDIHYALKMRTLDDMEVLTISK